MTIKAVMFDIGGVLLRTEDQAPRRKWETKLGLPPGGLAEAVFACETARQATVGLATMADVWRSVAGRFQLDSAGLRDLQRDFWAGDRLDGDLIQFLAGLRPGCKTALVSNAWKGLRAFYTQWFGLDDSVADVMIFSGEVGVAKPDLRIYQLAAGRLGVEAGESVFVDDFTANIEAAQQAGMLAVHFRSAGQAIQELRLMLGRLP